MDASPLNLLIRCDAGPRVGGGHLMRGMALAEAWGAGATIASVGLADAWKSRLAAGGIPLLELRGDDAGATIEAARRMNAGWIAVDGYGFDAAYLRQLADPSRRLLLIDDVGRPEPIPADLVLNVNASADAAMYPSPGPSLLLGPRYALLRKEFLHRGGRTRETAPIARRLLLTMGGSDPDNVTLRVLEALRGLPMELRVVVGHGNPHGVLLEAAAAASGGRLERSVQDMSEVMAWADLAVSSAGTSGLELAFMGLPSLLVVLADNQAPGAAAFERRGTALNLGPVDASFSTRLRETLERLVSDPKARRTMSERGRAVVDGRGAARVVRRLRFGGIGLRAPREDDARLLWDWANDAEARAVSFTSEAIPWETHREWFRQKLNDPCCLLYIASGEAGAPLGMVRFDREGERALVSISVAREQRGKGLGGELLWEACLRCFAAGATRAIDAWVKPGNSASMKLFEAAGFREAGREPVRGQDAARWILTRERAT